MPPHSHAKFTSQFGFYPQCIDTWKDTSLCSFLTIDTLKKCLGPNQSDLMAGKLKSAAEAATALPIHDSLHTQASKGLAQISHDHSIYWHTLMSVGVI